MRWEDLPESSNIEDRRGEGPGGGGGLGGMPIGRGGLGIGAILAIGLVSWALGIDPRLLLGGAEILSGGGDRGGYQTPNPARKTGVPQDQTGRFVSRILGSTERVWTEILSPDGKTYRKPILVIYEGQTAARCGGYASTSM